MKRLMPTLAVTLAALALATGAYAVPVETSTDLNLRAGPGVRHPVVATMPRGEVVELAGCDGSWCVVSYRGVRGWASGRYLVRIPFRPSPRGGFLSRLFQRSQPEPAAPDYRRARPVAPPPARAETPRQARPQAESGSETSASEPSASGTSARGGRGTAAPGILSEPTPAVRVPLPGETPEAEPEATGGVEQAARASQRAPTRDADADTGAGAASASADEETQDAPRRLRRLEAAGGDVL